MRVFVRKWLYVDPEVQGSLLLRVAIYWSLCILAIASLLLCWNIATGPSGPFLSHFRLDKLWEQYGIALIASMLLLPLMIWDTLRTSNRFVGPLSRTRAALRALAAGKRVEPLTFRKNDFWPELADEFNSVLFLVEQLNKYASDAATIAARKADDSSELEVAKSR